MGLVEDVPPRGHPALAPILAAYEHHHPAGPIDRICGAFELADAAHSGQFRRSGEPYITHPLAVAQLVAELGMDEASISAALCHDTIEDCGMTFAELAGVIGEDGAFLVDGVTKLDRLKAASANAAKAGTLRKLLVALAKDVRVLVIKLCDRLHNMRTIGSLPPEKAHRIATETLDVYAPLAHRLGMGEVKWQLEDLSFAVLHPERYEEIRRLVLERSPDAVRSMEEAVAVLQAALVDAGVKAEVTGRAKHLWGVYEKMVVREKAFEEIHDLVGIRVLVQEVQDCYAALGVVHSLWTPVPGRFKDYIATPKFNLYQSLHLTVRGPLHRIVEVQIRTEEMHRRAEHGIAAHWMYKSDKTVRTAPGRQAPPEPTWVKRLLEIHTEADDPDEFLAGLHEDLSADEVVVFTPKGDVVALPEGSTPLDFAYAVHTEVGNRTSGAKVNGRLVPLATRLGTGDTVEIITSKKAQPSYGWLDLVATPKARTRVRSWLTRERREDQTAAGREHLERSLRSEGLPSAKIVSGPELLRVAEELKYPDLDSLFLALGEHRLTSRAVIDRLRSVLAPAPPAATPPAAPPSSPAESPAAVRRSSQRRGEDVDPGVHIEGLDDVLVHIAKCCNPAPGDEILGYVTRGRGVSVHQTDCLNASTLSRTSDRCIDVEWASTREGTFTAAVELEAFDRPGLLTDVTKMFTDSGINILSCSTQTGKDQVARQTFTITLADSSQLEQVMEHIADIDGVYTVNRSSVG